MECGNSRTPMFFQLSLSAKENLDTVEVPVCEKNKLIVFLFKVFTPWMNESRYVDVEQIFTEGTEEAEIFENFSQTAKNIINSIRLSDTMYGEDAFRDLYNAGCVLASSASVGGCKATATIEHFFVKMF